MNIWECKPNLFFRITILLAAFIGAARGRDIDVVTETVTDIVGAHYVDASRAEAAQLWTGMISQIRGSLDLAAEFGDGGRVVLTSPVHSARIEFDSVLNSYDLLHHIKLLSEWLVEVDMHPLASQLGGLDSDPEVGTWTDSDRMRIFVLQMLMASLDAHSNLMLPSEYQELREGTQGRFGGLGIVVQMKDGLLEIVRLMEGSPASRSSLRAGERLVTIDGRPTYGSSLQALLPVMRGAPGSTAILEVLSEGEDLRTTTWRRVTLRREEISVPNVHTSSVPLGDGWEVAVIAIESFALNTAERVRQELARRRQNGRHLAGIILDLRGNPGGLLDEAVAVADAFLATGSIVTTRGRFYEQEVATSSNTDDVTTPLVVLIDGESASASEILAGALKDHRRAVLIGQPTFGKGSVQTLFELPMQLALKMTIARYRTPSDLPIQGRGVSPDVFLQPVFWGEKPIDILGQEGLGGERHLANALPSLETARGKKVVLQPEPIRERIFYNATTEQDVPRNAALKILQGYLEETRGERPGRRQGERSSAWLERVRSSAFAFLRSAESKIFARARHLWGLDLSSWGGIRSVAASSPQPHLAVQGIDSNLTLQPRAEIPIQIQPSSDWATRTNGVVGLHWSYQHGNEIWRGPEYFYPWPSDSPPGTWIVPLVAAPEWAGSRVEAKLGIRIPAYQIYYHPQSVGFQIGGMANPMDVEWHVARQPGGYRLALTLRNRSQTPLTGRLIRLRNLSGRAFAIAGSDLREIPPLAVAGLHRSVFVIEESGALGARGQFGLDIVTGQVTEARHAVTLPTYGEPQQDAPAPHRQDRE